MYRYKPLALFVFSLWLPVALIGVAEAAKPTSPEYAPGTGAELLSPAPILRLSPGLINSQ
jgi:hypothetical protein